MPITTNLVFLLVILLSIEDHFIEAYKIPTIHLRKRESALFRRDKEEKSRTFEDPKCLSKVKTDGISIINYGISIMNSSIVISGRFYEALEDLYNSDKEKMKIIVYENLEKYNTYDYRYFKYLLNDTLERAIIGPYTDVLYKNVNRLLREHKCGVKNLTENEKYSGPYVAYLMAILMYSNHLSREKNLTYRKISLEKDMISQYQVGTTFIWMSFTSSSRNERFFYGNTEFVFNNSQTSPVSPKRIEQYSRYEEEEEALYPPTAMFTVTATDVKSERTYIYADLVVDI